MVIFYCEGVVGQRLQSILSYDDKVIESLLKSFWQSLALVQTLNSIASAAIFFVTRRFSS